MSLKAGTRLGPYEILAPIGAGGMGEVYKARDTRLDRTVAVKILPEHLAESPERKKRFEREAKGISQLNHPHICTLHDVGHDDGIDFLVMEHIEGGSLADRLSKGALPLDEALRYGIHIADALDKAHRAGIAHRDLKPGNIVLSESGAKLLDFGLAARLPGQDSSLATQTKPLTQEGAVLGTLQYMAPEQLEGKDADARTDIFALGAVLYEMVTGEKALRNSLPVIEPRSAMPPLLDHVIRRCLANKPQERWQAASDVMHELTFIAEGGAAATGSPVPTAARSKREWLAWSVAAVSLVAAIITIVIQSPPDPSPVRRLTLVLSQGEELIQGPGYFGALSPDGDYLVYRAVTEGVQQLWPPPDRRGSWRANWGFRARGRCAPAPCAAPWRRPDRPCP